MITDDSEMSHFDALDTASFVNALVRERMRIAAGGSELDLCRVCRHEARWHAPRCQVCDVDETEPCLEFRT